MEAYGPVVVLLAFLETASNRKALSLGKPSPVMMRMARNELDLRTEEVTMIGDTMETDILGGLQMGYRTRLVCSGSTQPQDLTDFPYAPSLKGLIADL